MMESALEGQFKIHFNSNINRLKSIACGYSSKITILSNEDFNGISIFTLKKQQQFLKFLKKFPFCNILI